MRAMRRGAFVRAALRACEFEYLDTLTDVKVLETDIIAETDLTVEAVYKAAKMVVDVPTAARVAAAFARLTR